MTFGFELIRMNSSGISKRWVLVHQLSF